MKRPRRFDLEPQINAAQSKLSTPAAAKAARFEWALADTCGRVVKSMTGRDSRFGVQSSRAGMAIFAGAGSPFTQGMAMGLRGLVQAHELDAIEATSRRQERDRARSKCVRSLIRACMSFSLRAVIVRKNGSSYGRATCQRPRLACRDVCSRCDEWSRGKKSSTAVSCSRALWRRRRRDVERYRQHRVSQRQCGATGVSPARRAWRSDPGAARSRTRAGPVVELLQHDARHGIVPQHGAPWFFRRLSENRDGRRCVIT